MFTLHNTCFSLIASDSYPYLNSSHLYALSFFHACAVCTSLTQIIVISQFAKPFGLPASLLLSAYFIYFGFCVFPD